MAILYSSRSDQHRYCLGTWDRCLKWDTEALSVGLFPAPCNYYCSSVIGPCPGSWRTTSCGDQTHAFDVRSVLCILSREKLCEDETLHDLAPYLPTQFNGHTHSALFTLCTQGATSHSRSGLECWLMLVSLPSHLPTGIHLSSCHPGS